MAWTIEQRIVIVESYSATKSFKQIQTRLRKKFETRSLLFSD